MPSNKIKSQKRESFFREIKTYSENAKVSLREKKTISNKIYNINIIYISCIIICIACIIYPSPPGAIKDVHP